VPQLSRDKDIFALSKPLLDALVEALTDEFLIFVSGGSVKVSVPILKSVKNNLGIFDLPGAEANAWHVNAAVQFNTHAFVLINMDHREPEL
jgi:hypothetical protein